MNLTMNTAVDSTWPGEPCARKLLFYKSKSGAKVPAMLQENRTLNMGLRLRRLVSVSQALDGGSRALVLCGHT